MEVSELQELTRLAERTRSILDKSRKYRAEAYSLKETDSVGAQRLLSIADDLEYEAEGLARIALKLSSA